MDLILFGAFLGVSVLLYALGKVFKAFWFVAGGGALMLFLGVMSMNGGLYYSVVNQTNSSFYFSPDYKEIANDTVLCHSCISGETFNSSWNATPPSCCAHNVNTTIAGSIAESKDYYFESRALDNADAMVISLAFVLFGVGVVLTSGWELWRTRNGETDGGL